MAHIITIDRHLEAERRDGCSLVVTGWLVMAHIVTVDRHLEAERREHGRTEPRGGRTDRSAQGGGTRVSWVAPNNPDVAERSSIAG